MGRLVEIQYNPFLPRMQVLLDGKPPSDYSRIIQYVDEDIRYWGEKIFDVIYTEIMDSFSVIFTGMDQDADVVQLLCREKEYCLGFSARKPIVSDPLQERMKGLNQLIKHNSGIPYQKTVVEAFFVVQCRDKEIFDSVRTLDISNRFCSVETAVLSDLRKWEAGENRVLFFISDKECDREIRIKGSALRNPVYRIVIGEKNALLEVRDGIWIFETTKKAFLSTVFQCFLQEPLLLAFRKCARSVEKIAQYEMDIQRLLSTDPVIHIALAEKIEVGKSVRIEITSEQNGAEMPKLTYRIPEQEIAYCDGLCVFGKKEGVATLEVYRYGEKVPFCRERITVIKRNRIKGLFLSEDSLLLGIGDKVRLSCSYFPEDADNADMIKWKSSTANVVAVDENGNLTAVGEGQCMIICSAENISAKCCCEVKPYLKEIQIDASLEHGRLYLAPMEERELKICCVPEDCFDGDLRIGSSNCDIVNVIGNVLYAKGKGRALLTINNGSGRIKRVLEVEVKTKVRKKSSFTKTLFHKIRKE